MTVRPVDPDIRRRPIYATVALVLVMVAVLLAAGCVSPGFENKTPSLPEEKYIYLHHDVSSYVTVASGHCFYLSIAYSFPNTFNEKTGILSVDTSPNQAVNDSMVLFYNQGGVRYFSKPEEGQEDQIFQGGGNGFVYLLPRQFTLYNDNVTIESVTGDGTVSLRYNNQPVVLKPKERFENITRTIHSCECSWGSLESNPVTSGCSDEYLTTDSIYNAGIFDKSAIKVRETYQYTPVIPNLTASEWIRTYNNNLTPAEKKIPYEILQFIDPDYPKEYISFTKKELAAGYIFIPEENASREFNISDKTAVEHGGEINVRIDMETTASLNVVDPYATRIDGRDERNHSVLAWVGLNTVREIASLPEVKEIRPIIPPISFF
ncbi:MAG: hypothetical protein WC379_16190 [Methanoregula sp.]|jgi:hypothetical protein